MAAAAASTFSRQTLPSSSLFHSSFRIPRPPKFQFPKPRRPPLYLFCAPPPSTSHSSLSNSFSLKDEEEGEEATAESYSDDADQKEEEDDELEFDQWLVDSEFDSDENQQAASNSADSYLLPEGIVAEILPIVRNLRGKQQLDGYKGIISAKQCEEVLEILAKEEKNEGMAMNCLYFYEWMSSQESPLVTPRAFTILFPLLGKARMGDELVILFNNLPRIRGFRDVHVYNAAMSGFLYCGSCLLFSTFFSEFDGMMTYLRYDDACKVYGTMEESCIRPDHHTCYIMITIMRKQGRSSKAAWEFFQRMNRKGVKWSSEALAALIWSFCDEGLKEEALIILSKMEKKGVAPNVIMYNALMNAYGKSNQVEEAEGLFAEMKELGIKPTSTSYVVLMDAYSRRMQPEIVETLLKEMQDEGLVPDVRSYTCLISAYGRLKQSDKAVDSFLRMKRLGIEPTSHSYTALVHAYSFSGYHEKAYQVFEDMQLEGFKPGVETYIALLNSFRRAGDTETLVKIWEQMRNDKVQWKHVTFNTILDCFAKRGCYPEAVDVVQEFGKLGFRPTVMTYNMLMNAYARGKQHSKLPQLLKDMSVLNLKPDSVTFLTMIHAYVRVGDFKRAFFYHKQMVKSRQLPDANSYEKLKKALLKKAAMKNREDRSAILGIINSTAGLKTKKKEKKDEFWKNNRNHTRDMNSFRGR
ncbi:Pentatricopeptide repeat-containing protein At5g50280, chloroplastic [Linum perenne]